MEISFTEAELKALLALLDEKKGRTAMQDYKPLTLAESAARVKLTCMLELMKFVPK